MDWWETLCRDQSLKRFEAEFDRCQMGENFIALEQSERKMMCWNLSLFLFCLLGTNQMWVKV